MDAVAVGGGAAVVLEVYCTAAVDSTGTAWAGAAVEEGILTGES